jgi:BCD family chlorophyll transporter-like MFS transporter
MPYWWCCSSRPRTCSRSSGSDWLILDRHPLFGLRRTPYIAAGLLLCVLGLILAAQVALILPENFWLGLGLGILTFGAWGMGFNFATVAYFSLASEISPEQGRSKTTATMFFIMIVSIILSPRQAGC